MFKLLIVQADYGDCFILEYGSSTAPKYALIDGGPNTVYQNHLRTELQSIHSKGGHLDFIALSHIDDDHVKGLLDLTNELCKQKDMGKPLTIDIDALLHNSFSQTLGKNIEDEYVSWINENPDQTKSIFEVDPSDRSIRQGDKLTSAAEELGILINPGLDPSQPIFVSEEQPIFKFENLSLQVIGPTRSNMERLRKEWLQWINQKNSRDLLAPSDLSTPNMSSLMFLAKADGKAILFTGDGRSDDLLEGLKQAKLLDEHGCFHVDILKLPHHGSARNISKDFFEKITADGYIISANGRDDNPDLDTLIWIVEAAHDQNRNIEIYVTNQTKSTQDLLSSCQPDQNNYRLQNLAPGEDSLSIVLNESKGQE